MKNIVLLWHNNNNSTDKYIKCSLFFTIFHLTMVSSVMDCIGNRNLRHPKLIMCVIMFLSMSSCEYSDPVLSISTSSPSSSHSLISKSYRFFICSKRLFSHSQSNISSVGTDSSISNISSNEISSCVCPLTNHTDQLCQRNVIIRVTFFFTVFQWAL